MCGIVGYWRLVGDRFDLKELEVFTDSLSHRGPDGRGTYVSQRCRLFLGHRRLAVLDLSEKGSQPFLSGNKRYALVFNGEVYNFLEIKKELETQGYLFETQTDTEVVLKAYEVWGESCQLKFNGMWAMAIWDNEEQKLFLSRDRFGVKPLYYYWDGKVFAFASELKSFLALTSVDVGFNDEVFARSLCAPNFIEGAEETILQHTYNLRGGYCGFISAKSNGLISRKWWETLDYVSFQGDTSKERFLEQFEAACNLRMRSDVPLASALSGGMDSSSVVGMMAHIHKQNKVGERSAQDWRSAFVASFPGTPEDETDLAKEVAHFTDTRITTVELKAQDAIQHLESIIFDFEAVFLLPANGWLLYRAMRDAGKVVSMDGHGGDELLAGYHHYPIIRMLDMAHMRPTCIPALRTQYEASLAGRGKCDRRNVRAKIKAFLPKKNYAFGNRWLSVKPSPVFFNIDSRVEERSRLFQSLYFDFHYTLLPTILRNFDRVSMAHGVEIRAPFMDWEMVCLGFSLPESAKISDGYGKYILRDASEGFVPESVRWLKRKLGFVSPFTTWLQEGLGDVIRDVVQSAQFLDTPLWDGLAIQCYAREALNEKRWQDLNTCWPFIQAQLLINSFNKKRKEYLVL